MANRYWVGGTGNWNDAANHWSDVSGGTPGAGNLPTSGDDVIFDNLSDVGGAAATVTITSSAAVNNINFAGIDAIFTLKCTTASVVLTVNGSFVGSLNLIVSIGGSGSRFLFASTTAQTITMSGGSWLAAVYFNGVGGSWALQDDWACGGAISLYNGTLNLNGRTLSCTTFSVETGIKTLNINSGTLSISTSFSINAVINFTFTATGTVKIVQSNGFQLSCTLPFDNLTFEPVNSVGVVVFQLRTNITVNGTFTATGFDQYGKRLLVTNEFFNNPNPVILTAAAVSITNCDFFNITAAGAANWDLSAVAGGCGNGGNCTGITFVAPKTCYWYSNSGNYTDPTKWFSGSGGTGTANYYPLIHDITIFDAASFSSASTLTLGGGLFASMNFSAIDQNVALSHTIGSFTNNWFFGDLYLNDSNTLSNSSGLSIVLIGKTGLSEIDLRGKSCAMVRFLNKNAQYKLLGDIVTVQTLNLTNGTSLDTNNNDLTTGSLSISSSFGICSFTSSIITVTSSISIGGNAVHDWGTSSIYVTPTSGVDIPISFGTVATMIINKLYLQGNNTGWIVLSGGNGITINELNIAPGKKVQFACANSSNVRQFNLYALNAIGTALSPIYISCNYTTTYHILKNMTTVDFTVEYCHVSYSKAEGTDKIKTINGHLWAGVAYNSNIINKVMGKTRSQILSISGVTVQSCIRAIHSWNDGNVTGLWRITA